MEQSLSTGGLQQQPRPESPTIPQDHYIVPTVEQEPDLNEDTRTSYATHARLSTPSSQSFQEHQTQYRASATTLSLARDSDLPLHYPSLPLVASDNFVERVVSPDPQDTPPLARLEGYKVNKKSLVLDKEGHPTGELFEGDTVDCVRQKVNVFGDVVDDNGWKWGKCVFLKTPRPLRSCEGPRRRQASGSSTRTYINHGHYRQPNP